MKRFARLSLVSCLLLIAALGIGTARAEVPAVEGTIALDYAQHFTLDFCQGGYQLITVLDDKGGSVRFLTVPEGAKAPDNLDADVTVLHLPLKNLLVSSNPAISLINATGALNQVALTTTALDDWYIDEVKAAMETGALTYVGSYKEPDFEVLAAVQPPLSIFSAMLLGTPDVAEKLTELGIPYLVDASTYESHPLARVEWVKLYGALLGKEDEAQAVYQAQKELVEALGGQDTGKTAVLFYITSKGSLFVRNGGDYMARMLELAGGDYILADMNPDQAGTQQMEAEEFYAQAGDADVIFYIWSMGGRPADMAAFLARNEMLSELKAVKEGNVWCTTPDFFQISDTIGSMIVDMSKALNADSSETAFSYLFRLQ